MNNKQQSSIDEKLRKIKIKGNNQRISLKDGTPVYFILSDSEIAQIKQCFADTHLTDEQFRDYMRPNKYMSGQEFYSRFERELGDAVKAHDGGWILEAARRAAGITEAKDE